MKEENKENFVCELDALDAEQLNKITACKKACESMIHEVVKHWESNAIASDAFWAVLREKHDLFKVETARGFIIIGNKVYHGKSKAIEKLELENEFKDYLAEKMLKKS